MPEVTKHKPESQDLRTFLDGKGVGFSELASVLEVSPQAVAGYVKKGWRVTSTGKGWIIFNPETVKTFSL